MKKNIFSLFIIIACFLLACYVSWIFWWVQFLVSITIYFLVFFVAHLAWSRIFKKETKTIKDYFLYFFYRISIFISFLFGFFLFFIYFENILEPAMLPEFTISNWKKTVVFQWMAHIWSDKFYNQIQENIRENKKNWYVLFFEWVKPWSKENMKKFDTLIWFEFNKKTYSNLSKLYWLRAQDNNDFLNLINNKDYNTDVSMDTIIQKYEKKYWKVIPGKKYNNISDSPVKIEDFIDQVVKSFTENELKVLIQINRAMMNLIIKNENIRNTIMASSWQWNLFDIILDDRNDVIVKSIVQSKENKIHILYWLMHFNWVWQSLQQQDTNWKLINIRYFKPID